MQPTVTLDLREYLPKAIPPHFYPILSDKSRYEIIWGGAGSSKSHTVAQKKILRVISESHHKILIVRKVAKTLRGSVFALILDKLDAWGIGHLAEVNKTNMTISINGNTIEFLGLDDVNKLKSIEGVTSIWIEEADQLTEDDFDQLDLRLRGKLPNYKQITLTFNPINIKHWIKIKFFDNEVPDTFKHHSTYLDNIFIDDEYKAVFERLKITNRPFYNIYALGHWGVYEGLVFDDWSEIDKIPSLNWDYSGYGIDFGFNAPSSLVDVYIKGHDLYWDQRIYQSGLTNTDLIQYMKSEKVEGMGYADSAEPDRILEIKRAGFNCYGANKANRIDRINFVKSFNIHITKRSHDLKNELSTYVWDKDRDGNKKDEPIKVNDHAIDAACYSTYTQHNPPAKIQSISPLDF